MKFVLSISQMAFFVFLGIFVRGSSVISYIAVGNAIQSVAWNTVFSIVNITSNDKWQGTLPMMLATPSSRLPIFIGRGMIHVFDGMVSVVISLFFAAFVFGVDFGGTNVLALVITVLLTSITMAGYGLLIGGFSFYFREPLIFANIFTFVLLIFCGVNFPVSSLPPIAQPIAYVFPLTYGVDASRAAIAGSSIFGIAPELAEMALVGLISMTIGYLFFKSFENTARKTGRLEAQ